MEDTTQQFDSLWKRAVEFGKTNVELIKLKGIVYELEKATDVAEYVGKIIKTIIVKYA